MQELAEQNQAGPTTILRHEIIMLARDLHNEDTTVSRNAAVRVKDLVLASNPEQRQNQKLIANVDGLIDGLLNLLRRGSLAGKYYSCLIATRDRDSRHDFWCTRNDTARTKLY